MSLQAVFARIYRSLRVFGRWHEEQELGITVFEACIATIGVGLFFNEHGEWIDRTLEWLEWDAEIVITGIHNVQGVGEIFCLSVLLISIVARLAVILRGKSLGTNFGALFSGKGKPEELHKRLLHDLAAMGPRDGYLGSVISRSASTRKAVLDHIAYESASQFSIRTFGEADTMWKTWEERYLSEWLERFPAAIWRLPPDDPSGGEDSGYFSIAVPITEDAWRKVRYGHLSTALCAIDEQAVAYYNSERLEPYGRPIFLVFYTLIYVPPASKRDTGQVRSLLYSGVEHLAFLLSQYFPAPCNSDTASMSVICESPNSTLEAVLLAFGFSPVHTDFDLELEHTHIRKSVAGFHLFEIGYQNGTPSVGDKPRADRFLDLLCEIARRKPEPPRPRYDVEPNSEMTMVRRTH